MDRKSYGRNKSIWGCLVVQHERERVLTVMNGEKFFCGKCGSEVSGRSKFCPKCGTPIPDYVWKEDATNVIGADSDNLWNEENDFAGAEKKKWLLLFSKKQYLLAGVVAAVAVIAACLFVFNRPVKINLSNYLVLECSGYDGYGTANVYFDTEAFVEDYGDKIEYEGSKYETLEELGGRVSAAEGLAYYCIDYSVDYSELENGKLSDGAEVTIEWACNDKYVKKHFNVKLKYSNKTYTLNGFREVETVDVFSAIELGYSGTSPCGEVYLIVDHENSVVDSLSIADFVLSKESYVKNGDVVTVSISDSTVAYMAEYFGVVPEEQEKEYTVEGMDSFIIQMDDIPDDLMEDLKETSQQVIRRQVVNDFDDDISIQSLDYAGGYLFYDEQGENDEFTSYSTELYIVYRVNVQETIESCNVNNSFSYYTYVLFEDPILLADGTGFINSDGSELCDNRFEHEYERTDSSWGGTYTYTYYGYESMSELGNDLIYNVYYYNAYDTTVGEMTSVSSSDVESVNSDVNDTGASDTDADSSEYLCSFSSDRLITDADMEDLENSGYGELPGGRSLAQMIVNELYAKHGYQFESEELQTYFGQKIWYKASESDMNTVYNSMSQIEKNNIDYLQSIQ